MFLRKICLLVGIFLGGLIASGCRGHLSAPEPNFHSSRVPATQLSEVNLNLTVPIAVAQSAANRVVPAETGVTPYNENINGGAGDCGGVSLGYQVKRDPITLSARGTTISATTILHYWAKAQFKLPCVFSHIGPINRVHCGVVQPRAPSLTLDAELNGIGPNWSPLLSSSLADLHPLNRCKVNILAVANMDVTDHIVDGVSGAINRSLPSLDQ